MSLVNRTAGSFAVVVSAYLFYSLLIVPWIDPSVQFQDRSRHVPVTVRNDDRIAPLREIFPAGAWELRNPKILEYDQMRLLIGDYHLSGDNRVEVRPCTVILLPDNPLEDIFTRHRQAVVMQAPAGAILQFDRPVSLTRFETQAKPIGGQIPGEITIVSRGRSPGPEDDLWISTRDVQMNREAIWTQQPVTFRWGASYGQGRQLQIRLKQASDSSGGGNAAAGGDYAGIESFELGRIDRLHFEPPQPPEAAAAGNRAGATAQAALAAARPLNDEAGLPIEITCQGPFVCNLTRMEASFKDHVNVWRIHPDGPSDQMNCERLTAYLGPQAGAAAKAAHAEAGETGPPPATADAASTAAATASGSAMAPSAMAGLRNPTRNLTVQRLAAVGNPVVLSIPSRKAYAQAQLLEYDLVRKRITIESDQQAFLQQEANEVHARKLQYDLRDDGRLGAILASGPGHLKALAAERAAQSQPRAQDVDRARGDGSDPAAPGAAIASGQVLTVDWNDLLKVEPQHGMQLLTLLGGAKVGFGALGELAGREIYFWFRETPPQPEGMEAAAPPLVPQQLLATGNVSLSTADLDGRFERLEVWFEGAPRAVAIAPIPGYNPATARTSIPTGQVVPQVAAARERFGQAFAPAALHAFSPANERAANPPTVGAPSARIAVLGKTLQALISSGGTNVMQLAELQLHDGIHLEGRGFALDGPNVFVNRGANRIWMDGPGQMHLPVQRDLQGNPLAKGRLTVAWQKAMVFDGRTARFEQSVAASTTSPTTAFTLSTETLDVQVDPPIVLADLGPQSAPQPAVERVICLGGVVLDGREMQGQSLLRLSRVRVPDLAVGLNSGDLTAGGPGSLVSVFFAPGAADAAGLPGIAGASQPAGGAGPWQQSPSPPGAAEGAADAASAGAASSSGAAPQPMLKCLHVRFRGSVSGNIQRRTITLTERVRAAYDTAHDWGQTLEIDDPQQLSPQGYVLRCDALTVQQMPDPATQKESLELAAAGNTVVEGRNFAAFGRRISYAQSKELFVLEGDGRVDAELHLQQQVGGEPWILAGRRFSFSPRSQTYWGDGIRSLQMSNFPSTR